MITISPQIISLRIQDVSEKNDIWSVQSVSEKFVSFYNLIIWPIPIRMISNFNCMCKNNSKFYVCVKAFYFPANDIFILAKNTT